MARLDSYTAGRAQDRFDPRTAANVGQNAAASRRLNQRHLETPPAWATSEFGFTSESWTGGPYRAGRSESGQRSRSADARWDLGIGEHFR
jgi:hypothetical protein